MTTLRDLKKKIARLRERLTRLKTERRFLMERLRGLKEQAAPPAVRPPGPRIRVITKRCLNRGRWYLGIGRGSNVALWDGRGFRYIEAVMGDKSCHHWDDGPPFGCFQPFEEIDHHKYGLECRYVEDAKSRAKDRAWQKAHLRLPQGHSREPEKVKGKGRSSTR